MNEFTFTYPTKVYFGEGVAQKVLGAELAKKGKTVMLAYGGGSVKVNGIYDELKGILEEAPVDILTQFCRISCIRIILTIQKQKSNIPETQTSYSMLR